jgi:predicted aspartyl protease
MVNTAAALVGTVITIVIDRRRRGLRLDGRRASRDITPPSLPGRLMQASGGARRRRNVLGAMMLVAVVTVGCGGLHHRGDSSLGAGREPSQRIVVPAVVLGPAMFVTLKLEGHPYLFRIDTGALTTTVDASVAKALALRDHGASLMEPAVGCPVRAQPVAIPDWTLGAAKLPATTIMSTDTILAGIRFKGVQIGGLLGPDVLSRFGTVTLDFAHNRLILGGKVRSGANTIPIEPERYRHHLFITVRATIGGKTARYVIDTGSPTVAIQSRTAKKLGLKPSGASGRVAGVSGCAVNVSAVRLSNWAMGGKKMPAITAMALRGSLLPDTVERKGILGLIGAGALAPFRQVSIDFTKRRIQLGEPPG